MQDDRGRRVTRGSGWWRENMQAVGVGVAIGYVLGVGSLLALANAGPVVLLLLMALLLAPFFLFTNFYFNKTGGAPNPPDSWNCPACTFDLHGLTPASDGCTVCPECGHAWRLTDTGIRRP